MNIIDDIIVRDLNRIVNDRGVSQQHRNVARRAVAILLQMEGAESTDPDVVTCFCASKRSFTKNCTHCDDTGSITREKYRDILRDREERNLEIQGVIV